MNENIDAALEHKQSPMEIKDLYKTLLDTRNFEITMFWTRSNYFLILNSAIAVGFFNAKNYEKFGLVFAIGGLLASLLWFWVCLGGKYWQARWEQRLLDFEREYLPEFRAFGASPEQIQSDVERGLNFHEKMSCTQNLIYKLALKQKPSVSYSMIRLSLVFFFGWLAFIILFFSTGHMPFLN